MSGVLAALASGLVVGNVGWRGPISDAGREQLVSFWEYAAFLANSVVFVLIGGYEARAAKSLFTPAAAVALGLVLAARIGTVYPLCGLFARTRLKVDLAHQHVLVWGGLRWRARARFGALGAGQRGRKGTDRGGCLRGGGLLDLRARDHHEMADTCLGLDQPAAEPAP